VSVVRNLLTWSRGRDPRWVARRGTTLLRHYGITPRRAKRRVLACTALLERFGGKPMFAVPGRVVAAEPAFFRALADRGVELTPHGYDHVDFRTLTTEEARTQFERAGEAYRAAGILFTGFRCPYLSFTDEQAEALPPDMFAYGSNLAIRWEGAAPEREPTAVTEQLASFYRGRPASELVSRPRRVGELVEVPASLPDDFELTMGAGASPEEVARVWTGVWSQVSERGELFAPLFHPEAYDHLALAFERVLERARESGAWLATTGDIAAWWLERRASEVAVSETTGGIRLEVHGSPRVTVLVRGVDAPALCPWGHGYAALQGRRLELPGSVRPFVGTGPSISQGTVAALREEGFVVLEDADPGTCAVFLDGEATLTEREALQRVEETSAPLVRLWRWPDGAPSAVTIAGDLDALRLTDYLARFRAR
jgi:peptidoglycan/xylan/chitin deacetylase (PgdA/CDA1 family)